MRALLAVEEYRIALQERGGGQAGGGVLGVWEGGVRTGTGQGVGLPAGEQGGEAGGKTVEAVVEQDPGFGRELRPLAGGGDRAVGLGAEPGDGLGTALPGRVGGDGVAQAGQDGDQAGG